jgi:mono/diheme cytochrome c family protein
MNETLFYVLGLSLIALALVVSALGLRSEKFPPSRRVLLGGTLFVAAVVIGTMVFSWANAEDEQEHRNEEIAAGELPSPQEGLEQQGEAVQETTPEEATASEEGGTEVASAEGAQLFDSLGCSGCHQLEEAGSSGTTGPPLDAALADKDEQFIEASIVDPNDQIANGFPPDVMPQNYEDQMTPEELDALVQYLADSTAPKS